MYLDEIKFKKNLAPKKKIQEKLEILGNPNGLIEFH
jgi:hypothetical protein